MSEGTQNQFKVEGDFKTLIEEKIINNVKSNDRI